MKHPKIRCKCTVCGSSQLVDIQAIISGDAKCYRGVSLNRPKCCNGQLNYYSDSWEDTLLNVNAIMQHLRQTQFENERFGELVDSVADDLGCWAEGNQTPQEMGWVGQDGRP